MAIHDRSNLGSCVGISTGECGIAGVDFSAALRWQEGINFVGGMGGHATDLRAKVLQGENLRAVPSPA